MEFAPSVTIEKKIDNSYIILNNNDELFDSLNVSSTGIEVFNIFRIQTSIISPSMMSLYFSKSDYLTLDDIDLYKEILSFPNNNNGEFGLFINLDYHNNFPIELYSQIGYNRLGTDYTSPILPPPESDSEGFMTGANGLVMPGSLVNFKLKLKLPKSSFHEMHKLLIKISIGIMV